MLSASCAGVSAEMVADVLSPDDEPEGRAYGDGNIRLASSFWGEAESRGAKDRRGTSGFHGGRVVIHPVEILAGEGWIVSCWHRPRVFEGAAEVSVTPEPELDKEELRAWVARRWKEGDGKDAGDLGVLLLYELALGYAEAHRSLGSWLEDWELSYQHDTAVEGRQLAKYRAQLTELWGSMAVLRDWIRPQNRTGLKEDVAKAWLPSRDVKLVNEVDDRIDRALENLRELADNLRGSFNLLHVEQLEEARERREQLMRRVELVAAAFLIPTLIVGFYGANTWVPGQGARWGFWVMVAVLLLVSVAGVALVSYLQRRERGSSGDAVAEVGRARPPA